MTTLFLYGLGFCCSSIIVLLIWDAYAVKRRQREWAEDWKPPALSPSDDPKPSGGALLKRPMIFKPAFLITMAGSILLVAVVRWHSAATHQPQAVTANAGSQGDDDEDTASDPGNFFADTDNDDSWSFTAVTMPSDPTILQAAISGDDSAWPETFEWVAAGGLPSNSEADFNASATISLNLGLSAEDSEGESAHGADDADINCDMELINTPQLNYSLNGTSLSNSGRTKGIDVLMLMQ